MFFPVVCIVCCQVVVSATDWSLVQRSRIDCGAALCVITKPRARGGHSPRWAAEPEEKIYPLHVSEQSKYSPSGGSYCICSIWNVPCIYVD
jgi:hypothetical protein